MVKTGGETYLLLGVTFSFQQSFSLLIFFSMASLQNHHVDIHTRSYEYRKMSIVSGGGHQKLGTKDLYLTMTSNKHMKVIFTVVPSQLESVFPHSVSVHDISVSSSR